MLDFLGDDWLMAVGGAALLTFIVGVLNYFFDFIPVDWLPTEC